MRVGGLEGERVDRKEGGRKRGKEDEWVAVVKLNLLTASFSPFPLLLLSFFPYSSLPSVLFSSQNGGLV